MGLGGLGCIGYTEGYIGSKYRIVIYLPKTCTIITITQNPSTQLLGTWTLGDVGSVARYRDRSQNDCQPDRRVLLIRIYVDTKSM